jgi:hypothetical protein
VATRGGLDVDRATQIEVLDDPSRGQLEELLDDGFAVVIEDQLEELDPLVFQCLVDESLLRADLFS